MPKQKTTSLEFIQDIRPGYKNGMDLAQGYRVVEMLRQGMRNEDIAKNLDKPHSTVAGFVLELKKAGKAGMSLETYMSQGREFRPGKRIVE